MSANGVQAEFLDALDRHRGILVKVGNSYSRTPADRDDLIQEIIAQLWRSFPRYDGRAKLSTWMYRIALNVAITFYRSESRRARSVELRDPAKVEEFDTPVETAGNEALEMVLERVNQLDALNRAVMILYLDDRTYAEIAEIIGISETNVATKIGRIKQRLQSDIGAQQRK